MSPVKLVAVIDDEPDVLFTISSVLKRHGYEVITGQNADDLHAILDKHPDVILIDMNMPGKLGTVVCRELKETDATKKIRVIITSGNPHLEHAFKECGADSFLQKPFGKNELLDHIFEVIAS